MRKLLLLMMLGAVAFARGVFAVDPPKPAEPEGADAMKEAMKTGATAAQTFLSYLKPHATAEFPGTVAWVHGAGGTIGGLDLEKPSDAWRSLDPDQLITHNAAWWQAYYEVSPGDPGLALLHGSSLLCAGDPQRAMQVLRLALNYQYLDEGTAKIIISVIQHAGAYMEPSHTLVRQGLELHDKGDFLGAISKYDAALKTWPRNAWALYEKGLSVQTNEKKTDLPPLVVNLFARSRKLNPFEWSAWQEDVPGLREMLENARPIWEKSLKDINHRMSDDELTKFSDTLQLAGVDDLALVTRQILVQHRGRYGPADHAFIAKSLRRLVPGDRTEATLARLSRPSFKAIRLYGEPPEEKTKKATAE